MKEYLCLILVLCVFLLGHKSFADEVAEKTDGSFVGDSSPKPINSSFSGDTSNSVVNTSFMGEDVSQQTDQEFVGANTTKHDDVYFAGQTYQQQVASSTVPAFAQDNSQTAKDDGAFAGEDVQKKTDGSFSGDNYGQ